MDIRTFRSFVKTAMALQADQDTPGDYVAVKAAVEAKFGKIAGYGNHIGLAGLGTLAAPSVANMVGHPMSEKNKDRAEVVGLGVLGGEYAHNIAAARSARYAKSGIGQRLGRILAH